MKKLLTILICLGMIATINAQEKKAKKNMYEQHRSAKTGRYVTKSETKKSPNTTYTTKRKKKE